MSEPNDELSIDNAAERGKNMVFAVWCLTKALDEKGNIGDSSNAFELRQAMDAVDTGIENRNPVEVRDAAMDLIRVVQAAYPRESAPEEVKTGWDVLLFALMDINAPVFIAGTGEKVECKEQVIENRKLLTELREEIGFLREGQDGQEDAT